MSISIMHSRGSKFEKNNTHNSLIYLLVEFSDLGR